MCNVTLKKKDDRDWAELEIVKVIYVFLSIFA